jgi:CubicO group peptidase (beta-lactamase class C family)
MNKQLISEFIQQTHRDHALVGIAIGVVKNGQSVFEGGVGKLSVQKNDIVTAKTIFHTASVSKLFTSSAVIQLHEAGLIRLDDPPQQYLPYLKILNRFDHGLTIRNLLSHTAGIPDVIDYGWDQPQFDTNALERYIRSLDLDLLFEPGSQFSYSNIAYEILGAIISVVSGMPFETFMIENLFKPLAMKSSTFLVSDVPKENQASPHTSDLDILKSDIYPYNRAHAPSSTLHTNILDMNRWAIANLNKVTLFNHKTTFQEMVNPVIKLGDSHRPEKRVGLGWFLDERHGLAFQYHSGHDVGFTAYHLLVPQSMLGITVLCNTGPAPVEAIAFGILDIIERAIKPQPIKPHIINKLGQIFRNQGSQSMIEQYASMKTILLDDYDFEVDGFLGVANALLDRNCNEAAIGFLLAILQIFPTSAKGYEALARAYFQNGDVERAIMTAQRSLQIEPDNPFLRQQIEMLR